MGNYPFPFVSLKMKRIISLAMIALLSGCATYKNCLPFPEAALPVALSVSEEQPNKMNEFPIGAHYDEENRIILTGHQRGNAAGLMFGLVGVLAADSINKSKGQGLYGDGAKGERYDMIPELRQRLETLLADGAFPRLNLDTATEARLEIRPTALLVLDKTKQARLYAILKAKLKDSKQSSDPWHGRYFASADAVLPLEGDSGWLNGSSLKDGLTQAFDRATWALVNDVNGNIKEGQPAKITGKLAWLNIELKDLPGAIMTETEDFTVVRMYLADVNVMAGTHVFKPGEVRIEKVEKVKDPRPTKR